MGIVNNYIKKLIEHIKPNKEFNEKPWLKYYENEHLNYNQGSIYDALYETAQNNPNRIAYKYYGLSVTYKKFIKIIDKVAYSLKQFNVVENECVTMCLPNTPESFALIYAINKIGAIANIIHPLSTTNDIVSALKETNSNVLFCSDVSMPKAKKIDVKYFIMVPSSNSLGSFKKFIYNTANSLNMKLNDSQITWEEFMNKGIMQEVYVKRKSIDPAAIIYSGGTTGKPKGIIISNLNFNAMAAQTYSVCDYIRPGNSVLAFLPIFHVFGLSVCVHTCLVAGMTLIIVPKLNTKKASSELKKYKPDVFPAVPTLLKMVMNGPSISSNALSNIKIVVVGGDYLPPEIRLDMEEYLKDHGSSAKVKVGYGLSEATGFASATALIDKKQDSIGIPNPDMNIKIFEPNTDIEKSRGDIGEICINGPTVMMGYINEDVETKKTLVVHNDGKVWLHTGDLGYMDEDGIFFYTSRLKRMIISNGYNVYPIELENIICKHKYVSDCTIIGVNDKVRGQAPKAVIVLKKGIEDTKEVRMDIQKYCFDNIAAYARIVSYEYRTSIPMSAIGKVAYRDLENKKTIN